MLLRFGFENVRSFRDYNEVSFVSTSIADSPQHTFTLSASKSVLPVMGIYGSNASGKSNIVIAFSMLRDLVVNSFVETTPGARMPFEPFALSNESANAPTLLDVTIALDGIRYEYGVRYDATRVVEEWLYAWPRGRRQVWFHRDHSQDEPFYFGPNFRNDDDALVTSTRPNALFLSTAAQYNHAQLTPLYLWFSGLRRAPQHTRGSHFRANAPLARQQHADVVATLLRRADLGVCDYRFTEDHRFKLSVEEALTDAPAEIRDSVASEFRSNPLSQIELAHCSADGPPRFLPADAESTGTRAYLVLINLTLSVLTDRTLLVGDELDSSLHPRMSAALINLFTDSAANPHGGQLLFTTHDTTLLGHLRRDEVVFVEKDPETGASSVIPLTEYRTRKRDDIQTAYEQGRFGGVPVISGMADAIAKMWEERSS